MSDTSLTRINKFLSEIGYCSRRAADKLIEQGRVKINGEVPEMGTKISAEDEVSVNGKVVHRAKKKKMVYIAFNNCGSHIPSSAIADSEKNPAITIDKIFFVIFLFFV